MARKDFYVAKDTPHPLYKTRMLQAGVAIPLDASAARLYERLGVELSEEAPKRAAPKIPAEEKTEIQEPVARTIAEHDAPKPAAKKAPAKKATRRKKS